MSAQANNNKSVLPKSNKKCSHSGCYEKVLSVRIDAGETTCHIHDEKLVMFRDLYCQGMAPNCNHLGCKKFPQYLDDKTNLRYCESHKPNNCMFFIRFPNSSGRSWTCCVQDCPLKEGCSKVDESTGLTYCSLHATSTCLAFQLEEFKKCGSVMCSKIIPKDSGSRYCILHAPDTKSAVVITGYCFSCSKSAEYGLRVGGEAFYCVDHKLEGMVRVDGVPLFGNCPKEEVVDNSPQEIVDYFPIRSVDEDNFVLDHLEINDSLEILSDSILSVNVEQQVSKFPKLDFEPSEPEWEVLYKRYC